MDTDKKPKGKLLSLIAFPLLIVSIVMIVIIFHKEIWLFFATDENNTQSIQKWLDSWGIIAPLAFIALQILQVVIFIIPGEVTQIAGGFFFGYGLGIIYSSIGIAIGSAINFYLARTLGMRFVSALFTQKTTDKMEKVISSSKSIAIYFILFLIPGIPKDVICYVAGLSRIRFITFIILSSVGRLPGLILSVIVGVALANKDWLTTGIAIFIAIILLFFSFIWREKIIRFIQNITR